jgi:small subunit ribosomal protein S3
MDAVIVGETVAKQIEGRINHRRAIKMAIQQTIRTGAEGIKIRISGRVGGSDMARTEEYKEGRTPLHTFRADIDYANVEAQTVYGKIGIKVWICKGEVFGKRDLSPFQEESKGTGSQDRRGGSDRRDSDRGDRRDGGRGDRRGGGDNRGGGDRKGGGQGGNRGGGQGGNRGPGGGQGGNRGGGQGGNRGPGGGQGGPKR